MMVELQPLINTAFGIVSAVAVWFFARVQDHEKRVQKIEDLHTQGIDDLKQDLKEIEIKFDKMQDTLNDLTLKINNKSYNDNDLAMAINSLIKKIDN
jgi:uncharacterized coiled-coil protein SlyX